jgi:tetratricopeptide (TPR) repeat protein
MKTGVMIAALEDLFRRDPRSREASLNYHSAAVASNEFARAEATLRSVLDAGSKDQRLQFLLIDLLLRQKKDLAAMTQIEAAMADFGVDDGILSAALAVRERLGLYRGTKTGGVSLCMIVKDEEEYLARCLHSGKPVVDEIIVVDTGSTDRSKKIARAYGAKVIDQVWRNDFSKARNKALAEASGDLIFVLDGDEVISPKDYEGFRNLLQTGTGASVAYTIQTRNYSYRFNTVGFQLNRGEYAEEAGAGWFPSSKVRLFPNDPRVRFTYAVHEVVEPALIKSGVGIRRCEIPVHHYGKLSEDRTVSKTTLYQAIGRQKLSANQTDPAALREAAIQASQLGHNEEALELWQRFVQIQPGSAEAFVNLASAFFNLRRYTEAEACAEKAIALDPTLKEAHFNAALASLILGRADRAISILSPWVTKAPDYPAASFILAACHACKGSENLFQESLRELSSSPLGTYLSISIADLAERLLSSGQRGYAMILLQSAVRYNYTSPEINSLIKYCQPAA